MRDILGSRGPQPEHLEEALYTLPEAQQHYDNLMGSDAMPGVVRAAVTHAVEAGAITLYRPPDWRTPESSSRAINDGYLRR